MGGMGGGHSRGVMDTARSGFQAGQAIADPQQALPTAVRGLENAGRKTRQQAGQARRDLSRMIHDPAGNKQNQFSPDIPISRSQRDPESKSMLMECCDHDPDVLHNFLESLSDKERSIIERSNDPEHVMKIRLKIDDDLNSTAKDLAMED